MLAFLGESHQIDFTLSGVRYFCFVYFRLHGSMQQTERTGVFAAFRKCKQGVLLATVSCSYYIEVGSEVWRIFCVCVKES